MQSYTYTGSGVAMRYIKSFIMDAYIHTHTYTHTAIVHRHESFSDISLAFRESDILHTLIPVVDLYLFVSGRGDVLVESMIMRRIGPFDIV